MLASWLYCCPHVCPCLDEDFFMHGSLIVLLSLLAVEPVELVLRGGKIVTMDQSRPQATALAARGQRIVAVGTDDEIRQHIGDSTRVIDLGGKLAIPGFIEGHGHFTGVGEARMVLDLSRAESWDEVVQLVARAAANTPPGKWIHGRGWHQGKWTSPPQPNVEGYPKHDKLSQVSPNHPVWLRHGTGHMSFANAKAMELAGIARTTQAPNGGEILRDGEGDAVGVFRETAQDLFDRALATDRSQLTPAERTAEAMRAFELANAECLSKGITSFQDAGSSFATIDRLRLFAEQGRLGVRLWVMTNASNRQLAEKLLKYRWIGLADGHLTVRGIKRMFDGALGTHGAWMLEPYDDLPTSRGLNTASIESLARTADLAQEHDFQLCVHAIGDRANREVLNLFEKVASATPEFARLRWRIEHAQHLHPADMPRFKPLGVIASMQANHATSDGPFVIDRLGVERARQGAYVWKNLLDAGAIVTNGTDAPVEDVNPLGSFHAAVTRRMRNGQQFFPEQCMTREQALRSYTLDAAYAAFEEEGKGSLTSGKLADIVVLSKDILTVDAEEIPSARVLYTIVGGKIMYQADSPSDKGATK
jgi:predicted amidohydrolase YtcJ